jgi:hypothetical protein
MGVSIGEKKGIRRGSEKGFCWQESAKLSFNLKRNAKLPATNIGRKLNRP